MSKLLTKIAIPAALAFSAFGTQAAPIALEIDQPTQMKFSDYEIALRPNANGAFTFNGANYSLVNGSFAPGDKFVGIFNVTSIGTTSQPNDLSAQLASTQLTGVFSITITNCDTVRGCGSTTTATNSHMDFALGTGDFIRMYTAPAGTINPTLYNGTSAGLAAAVTSASGAQWLQANGPASNTIGLNSSLQQTLVGTPGYVGYSNSANFPVTATINDNWANADVNNTGYVLIPQQWPGTNFALAGLNGYCSTPPCPVPNPYTPIGPLGLVSDVFFQSQVNFNTNATANGAWQFLSQDPLLLFAPEPASLLLFGTGLLGLGFFRQKRSKA